MSAFRIFFDALSRLRNASSTVGSFLDITRVPLLDRSLRPIPIAPAPPCFRFGPDFNFPNFSSSLVVSKNDKLNTAIFMITASAHYAPQHLTVDCTYCNVCLSSQCCYQAACLVHVY